MKSLFAGCILLMSSIGMASDKTEISNFVRSNLIESATYTYTDGIESPLSVEARLQVVSRLNFQKFSTIMSKLHEEVESETDIVYLVNTSDKDNACSSPGELNIPKQHMLMLKRTSQNHPMFLRDSAGKISGLDPYGAQIVAIKKMNNKYDYNILPRFTSLSELDSTTETPFIPVSTGVADGNKILTYSGIFRINERRTNDMRKSTNTTADPMQWSVYINAEYNDGREARVALHGTSQSAWALLGKQRASSGCIRLQSNFSKWNQELLFRRALDGQLIPRSEYTSSIKLWNRRDYVPPTIDKFQNLTNGEKLRVLVVFFDGYNTTCI